MAEFIDRTGERYGKLLVLRRGPAAASGASWFCRCDCGTEVCVTASNLKKGQKACAACGLAHARVDLTGRRFGRLVVLNFAKSHLANAFWLCQCDCGRQTTVNAASLTKGATLSCGCLGRERRLASRTKHGMVAHPVYVAWENMKQRCLNPRHIHFDRYGARGIKICDRWLKFEAFRDDVLPTWQRDLTLDRVNPSGNYEPGNFEWVTRQRQTRNREMTLKMEFEGAILSVAEVSERTGIKRATLLQRMHRGIVAPDLFLKKMPNAGNRTGRYGRTHGMSTHPAYNSWRSAKKRCEVMTTAGYEQYGGRGIQFADDWQEFENFWRDMGPSWASGLTLDRKDVNGNYEFDNCRWATPVEQAANRRTTVYSVPTPLGTMTIAQASKQYGIKRNTLMARIRYGWTDPEKMVQPAADKTAFLKRS